jgi:hypothetical protein
MPSMHKVWLTTIMLAGVLAGAAGCKQGVGNRCQLLTDCQNGLVCVLPNGATCAAGGICQQPTDVGRPCDTGAQCAAGLVCTPVAACPYAGHGACLPTDDGGADLAVSGDLLPPPVDLLPSVDGS